MTSTPEEKKRETSETPNFRINLHQIIPDIKALLQGLNHYDRRKVSDSQTLRIKMFFWVLTPCRLLGRYQRVAETHSLRI
jgi:hypothetical protein